MYSSSRSQQMLQIMIAKGAVNEHHTLATVLSAVNDLIKAHVKLSPGHENKGLWNSWGAHYGG